MKPSFSSSSAFDDEFETVRAARARRFAQIKQKRLEQGRALGRIESSSSSSSSSSSLPISSSLPSSYIVGMKRSKLERDFDDVGDGDYVYDTEETYIAKQKPIFPATHPFEKPGTAIVPYFPPTSLSAHSSAPSSSTKPSEMPLSSFVESIDYLFYSYCF
jgi:hypothetical protein